MGVSILARAHLAMKRILKVSVRQNIVLLVSYDAIPPYGGSGLSTWKCVTLC